MVKKYIFGLLGVMGASFYGMENGSLQEIARIKNHIINKNSDIVYYITCAKYKIIKRNGTDAFYAENKLYGTEKFYTVRDYTPPFNIIPNTVGIMEVRYGDAEEESMPLMDVVYYWNHESSQLSLHINHVDKKSQYVDPRELTRNSISLVLAGDRLQDSYFFYPGMPEED